jgi:hypothetical protein
MLTAALEATLASSAWAKILGTHMAAPVPARSLTAVLRDIFFMANFPDQLNHVNFSPVILSA